MSQCYFGEARFTILVAIADGGIIERRNANPPELMKADQICGHVSRKIEYQKNLASLSGFAKSALPLTKKSRQWDRDYIAPFTVKEMQLVKEFLLDRHVPLVKSSERERPMNAGALWTSTEDEQLRGEFEAGMSIADIANGHGRTRLAIESRIEKLEIG